MARDNDWAAVAAVLPEQARAERERPFWQALARDLAWRRVVDAGCGSGFHVRLLRELSVEAVGFDAAPTALVGHHTPAVVGGDLNAPPLREGIFDAALCLGNTFSLLPRRALQREGLGALIRLVRPGGVVLLQGEDVGVLVAGGPVVRTRRVDEATAHVRVFERVGRRVRLLAGVVRGGVDAPLAATWLVPTSKTAVERMARALGLVIVTLPAPPPSSGTGWWTALSARST